MIPEIQSWPNSKSPDDKCIKLDLKLNKEQYGFILFMSEKSSPEEYIIKLIQDQVNELNHEASGIFCKGQKDTDLEE